MSSFSQINTNIQSLQAFQNLSDTSKELATRQERLTTGLRINSAEDDAAGFQIAKQLEAKTGAQQQALRNIGDAKSALSTAEGALDSQLDILQSAKEKATQAANGSLSQNERNAIAGELTELSQEVDDIQASATFNGDNLLSGSNLSFQTGAGTSSENVFEVQTPTSTVNELGIGGDLDFTDTGADSDSDEAVSVEKGDFSGTTFSDILDGQGDEAGTGDIKADTEADDGTAATGTDVKSNLAGDLDGGTFDITVTDTDDDEGGTEKNLTFQVNGSQNKQTVDVSSAGNTLTLEEDGDGNKIKLDVGNIFAAGDVSEGESKEFSVSVRDTDDIGARLEGTEASPSSTADARSIIDDIDDAIETVTGNLSELGASQNRLSFKESNLETSRTNLESARSQIEDADFAREQTRVAKLQVLQQSGTAQLAQANAAGQSVLSLLGG